MENPLNKIISDEAVPNNFELSLLGYYREWIEESIQPQYDQMSDFTLFVIRVQRSILMDAGFVKKYPAFLEALRPEAGEEECLYQLVLLGSTPINKVNKIDIEGGKYFTKASQAFMLAAGDSHLKELTSVIFTGLESQ